MHFTSDLTFVFRLSSFLHLSCVFNRFVCSGLFAKKLITKSSNVFISSSSSKFEYQKLYTTRSSRNSENLVLLYLKTSLSMYFVISNFTTCLSFKTVPSRLIICDTFLNILITYFSSSTNESITEEIRLVVSSEPFSLRSNSSFIYMLNKMHNDSLHLISVLNGFSNFITFTLFLITDRNLPICNLLNDEFFFVILKETV